MQRQFLPRRIADAARVAFDKERARFVRRRKSSGGGQPDQTCETKAWPNCEAGQLHGRQLAGRFAVKSTWKMAWHQNPGAPHPTSSTTASRPLWPMILTGRPFSTISPRVRTSRSWSPNWALPPGYNWEMATPVCPMRASCCCLLRGDGTDAAGRLRDEFVEERGLREKPRQDQHRGQTIPSTRHAEVPQRKLQLRQRGQAWACLDTCPPSP